MDAAYKSTRNDAYSLGMATTPLSERDLAEVTEHATDAFTLLRGAKIFVTGGTGFFGHWLLETLLHADKELNLQVRVTALTRSADSFLQKSPHIANHPSVSLLEGDIRNFPFPAKPHTHVIHAATDSGSSRGDAPAYDLAESIVDGTRRVLQFARHTGATRLLYTSSGAVYGRSTNLLHTPEIYLGASDPLLLQSSYDEGKRMAEHLCVAYAHGTPLEPVIARCFAFVGPHLPLDQHFAIGNFIRAAMQNETIQIKGDGTPRRSWLYMSDLAAWIWRLLVRGQQARAYNVGSDEGFTIREAAEIAAATLRPNGHGGSELSVHVAGVPTAGAALNSYVPSIDRAQQELGLRVTVPLSEALLRTAEWHGFVPPVQSF